MCSVLKKTEKQNKGKYLPHLLLKTLQCKMSCVVQVSYTEVLTFSFFLHGNLCIPWLVRVE